MSKKDYPIGATWEATDKNGRRGTIWLAAKEKTFNIWRWSSAWSDGSGSQADWGTSYASCKAQINVYAKFKRTV